MKKFAKLSLVAAVAVAGLTNVNAASLEEAIQNVKIKGNISYTMEKVANASYTEGNTQAQHDLDIRVQAMIPVNDNISATVRLDESQDDDNDDGSTNANSIDVQVDRAFFTYKTGAVSVNAGLIGAPLTDGAQADGATASFNLGSASLTAGYLYTTALGADEVAFAAVSGSVAPVSYSLAYAKLLSKTEANEADFLHAGVSANVGPVTLGANYGTMMNVQGADDQSQYKLGAKAKVGMVSLGLAYAANDQDGGETMIDGSDVAASNISVGDLDLSSLGDASGYQIDLGANVTSADSIALTYAAADVVGGNDQSVIKGTFTHTMSKNFKVYANYELNDMDNADEKMSELTLGANYTF